MSAQNAKNRNLDAEFVRRVIREATARCVVANAMGGVPLQEVVDGRQIPDGWKLDPYTMYYLPPDISAPNRKLLPICWPKA